MEQEARDIEGLVDRLAAKEKSRRRNALIYLGLPLLAGVTLTIWTVHQAQVLKLQNQALDSLRTQFQKTKEAGDQITWGTNLARKGELSEAIAAYDRAIELDPNNPVVYEVKGYALLVLGRMQEAVESLRRSIEIDSSYIWGHYNLALAYWKLGERSMALEEVEKTLELDSTFRKVIIEHRQFKGYDDDSAFCALLGI